MHEALVGLREYFDLYNIEWLYQSLDYKTPWGIYKKGYIALGSLNISLDRCNLITVFCQ
ncbi:MAG: hypothetical protein KAI03_01850 [Candidatus Aureabacteria bacterium]|nr:hypothetical protein [Candidatus Auribacterota bacterium]